MTTNETEFISGRQWDSYARRIERANIKATGQSITFTGIARRAQSFIIEMLENDTMLVHKGWREAMKQEAK